MNTDKPVTIGLVGCGRVAMTRHLPALLKLPNAEVAAITDSDPQGLQAAAEQFQIKQKYSSLQELLKNPEIEAVGICVPLRFHAELGLEVLDAGKHLFIEKPLAFSTEECRQLIDKGRKSQRISMVGFNLRWHRLVRETQQMLNRIGDVMILNSISASGSRNAADVSDWRLKRNSGGGVLIEQAIHHFDLWRFLLQDEVEEVFATSLNEDETATVTARMSRGALIAGTFCEGTAHDNEVTFFGNKGRLRLRNYQSDGLEFLPPTGHAGDFGLRIQSIMQKATHIPQLVKSYRAGGDFVESYSAEWRHFLECIRRNVPATPSLEDGYRAVQILEAVLESTTTGKPVSIKHE